MSPEVLGELIELELDSPAINETVEQFDLDPNMLLDLMYFYELSSADIVDSSTISALFNQLDNTITFNFFLDN